MKKILLPLMAVALFATQAAAQLQDANDVSLGKVKTANESVKTIECPFSRTQKTEGMDNAPTEKGTFRYLRPGMLSMEYESGETFVINETNVLTGAAGKARTLKKTNKHVEDLAETLLYCVSGNVAKINGKLTKTDTNAKTITYSIASDFKVGRSKIKQLTLVYSAQDLTLISIKMIELDGSYTLYELGDKKLNPNIDPKIFEIKQKREKK